MSRRNSRNQPSRRSDASRSKPPGRPQPPGKRGRAPNAGKRPRISGTSSESEGTSPGNRSRTNPERRGSPRSHEKPPYPKRRSESGPKGDDAEKRRSYKSNAPLKERQSFKQKRESPKRESPPTGLRRERPYKSSEQGSEVPQKRSAPPGKRFGQGSGNRSKKIEEGKGKMRPDLNAPVQTGKVRLNKFIANSGVCSRREADELIKMGLISVNGKVITELGYKIDPGDEVRHESRVLRAEKPVYILLNKPKGFLTTTSDPQERNTVMHLVGNVVKERVYPVGRLDRNTTGLLLLTNDGDLAEKLMHPSYNVKKIYKVELDRPLTKADAQLILAGVQLEEGKAIVDDLAIISDDKRSVGVEIHIGWNRVIRRIFEALNYEVTKLDRTVYAGLDKKNLGRGEWRYLTKEELVRLKHY